MRRIRLRGLAAALIMGAILLVIGNERTARPVFDIWQQISQRPAEPSQTEIVWIDEASVRTIGPWPWPRYTMARFVAKLHEDRPRLIGMDMLFPEADRNSPETFVELYPELAPATAAQIAKLPAMDALFGQVIGEAPVVLGRAGLDADPDKNTPSPMSEARFSAPLPASVRSWGQAVSNIPVIDDVGLGHGLLNGEPDSDGVVRFVPLAGRVAGVDMPGFALELARVARGIDRLDPVVSNGELHGLRLGDTLLPSSPDGSMRVPFRAAARTTPVSALDVLYDMAPSRRLSGKIVIVGLSGAGTADLVSTPLDPKAYGATVHADAVEAILSGETLVRPRWAPAVEAALAILLTGLSLIVLPRLNGPATAAACIGLLGATFAGSWAAFANAGLLLNPVGPSLTAIAAGLNMFILLFAKARRDRARLSESLQEERVASAQAAGELSAARTIQLGMLPPREGLAGLHPRVELDALIEPARSIGGDFYDAMRLDEHRLCFLVGDVTGKGVPAALFMALSKALSKSVLLREGGGLADAVTRLNDEIARDNTNDMFVTMVIGLLDTRDGALELCNAGHENPWFVSADGRVEHVSLEGGPPLSVAANFRFSSETLTLAPGDAVVFVSDGITEAQNRNRGFFGNDKIARVLEKWKAGSAAAASEALLNEVRSFEAGSEATDDLTVLVFRYLT